jgi:tRNA(Phe) wybutosine-synthesizing methylase Tyw3
MVPPSCTLSNFLLVSPVVEENRKNCNHCILIKMQISIIHVKFTNFHQCDDLTKLKLFKVNILSL